MNGKLKYTDDVDKSLGLAGMAITLVACDSEELIASVSMEDDEEPLEMAGEFFFGGNPRFSAKIAWNEILRQYQITMSLLLGNVLCRNLCTGRDIDNDVLQSIHEIILSEGMDNCSLEEDEIDALYNKNYRYYHNLFSHPSVGLVARDFATTLRMQRRMSAGEIIENLRRLSTI